MSDSDTSDQRVEQESHLLENIFLTKRQEMVVRLLEAEDELKPELPPDRRVYIIGEPGSPDDGPRSRSEPPQPLLSVRSSWLRVHNKKWILGTTLLNTSQSETVSLGEPALRTVPWVPLSAALHCLSWLEGGGPCTGAGPSRAKRARVAGAWHATHDLPPGALAHALTVVDVDLAWPDTVLLEQLFAYTANHEKNDVTTSHELTAQGSKEPAQRVFPRDPGLASDGGSQSDSVLDSTLTTPAQLDLAPDLLSVQVTSKLMELVVRSAPTENLRRALTKVAGFETAARAAPRSYLLHRGARNPLLKGVMLIAKVDPLDRGAYKMAVYARDEWQAERVLRALLALPTVTLSAAPPPPAAQQTAAQALHQEQRFVQKQLARMLRGPDDDIAEETFRRFRTRLSELELVTDRLALDAVEKETNSEDRT